MRVALTGALAPHVREAYAQVSDAPGEAVLAYRSSVGGEEAPRVPHEGTSVAELAELLLAGMARSRDKEIERGVTLVGPHRDDLLLELAGLPAKGYASHGESWSLALALRLAAFHLLSEGADGAQDLPAMAGWDEGSEPVLILDDVFAELDTRRRARLATLVADAEQVLVTAAVPEDVPEQLQGSRLSVVDGGSMRPEDRDASGADASGADGRRDVPVGTAPADAGAVGRRAGGGAPRPDTRVGRRARGPQPREGRRPGRGLRPGSPGSPGRSGAPRPEQRSGPGRDGRDPVTVGETLDRLAVERGWSTELSVGGVIGRWRDVVGDQVADHCTPETFDDGLLAVRTDSTAWATNLTLLVPELLARLATELGPDVVTEVRVLGPAAPRWSRGRRSVPGRGPRDTYG